MARTPRAVREHKAHAPRSVKVAVLTVSDSKDEATDESGRILRAGIDAAGHEAVYYALIPDDSRAIRDAIDAAADRGADAVVTSGGTGIAERDVTAETVALLLEKTLDGFGDLFHLLSFREIGSAAMMSRAVAGVYRGTAVFCLPGSPEAVRLAWDKLIRPELPHIVGLLRK